MKKKNEVKYNAWKEFLEHTRDRTNYAARRIDLLIISISGAGIYIIFETIREFKTGNVKIEDSQILMFSGILLLGAIIANFLSQVTGHYANNYEEKYINLKLRQIEKKKFDKEKMDKYNGYINKSNLFTKFLNSASIVFMFIGLILLTYFNFRFF